MFRTLNAVILLFCIANIVGKENHNDTTSARLLKLLMKLQKKDLDRSPDVKAASIVGMTKRAVVTKAYKLMEYVLRKLDDKVKVKQRRHKDTEMNKGLHYDCSYVDEYYYNYNIEYTFMAGCGCMSPLSYCNGMADCFFGEDEDLDTCRNIDCPAGFIKCREGSSEQMCIPLVWLCDDYPDCDPVSAWDERPDVCREHCKDAEVAVCGPNNPTCVRLSWFCDGDDDCGDGVDEDTNVCRSMPCAAGETRCQSVHAECFPNEFICDEFVDCFGPNTDENSATWDELNCDEETCYNDEFSCEGEDAHFSCIPGIFVCDNINDCGDGADEDASLPGCGVRLCEIGEYSCATTNICVPLSYLCDSWDDCGDNSDENLPACDTDVQCFERIAHLTTSSRHVPDFRVLLGRQAELLKEFARAKRMTSKDVRKVFSDENLTSSLDHHANN